MGEAMAGRCPRLPSVHPHECGRGCHRFNRQSARRRVLPRGAREPPRCIKRLRPRKVHPHGAGSPIRFETMLLTNRSHPRRCREVRGYPASTWPGMGTSPRVRGSPPELLIEQRVVGSIPTDAGEPSTGRGCRRSARVHPRGFGEPLTRNSLQIYGFKELADTA